MPKYRVFVREVWTQAYEVEDAPTGASAVDKVARSAPGVRELSDLHEWSHQLSPETWTYEEVK